MGNLVVPCEHTWQQEDESDPNLFICGKCGEYGYFEDEDDYCHDCGEDTCCCLEPWVGGEDE